MLVSLGINIQYEMHRTRLGDGSSKARQDILLVRQSQVPQTKASFLVHEFP